MKKLFREPLVHFLLLGAVLFGLYSMLNRGSKAPSPDEIVVTSGQIETLAGSQAFLMKRVQTELLSVSINSYHAQSFWSPIGDSARSFSEILSASIAGLILAVAYLLPWAVVVSLLAWAVRAFLRIRKRRRAEAAAN